MNTPENEIVKVEILETEQQVKSLITTHYGDVKAVEKLVEAVNTVIKNLKEHKLENRVDTVNYADLLKKASLGFSNAETLRKTLNKPYADSVKVNNEFFKKVLKTEDLESLIKTGKNRLVSAEQVLSAQEAKEDAEKRKKEQEAAELENQKTLASQQLAEYITKISNEIAGCTKIVQMAELGGKLATMPAAFQIIKEDYETAIIPIKKLGAAKIAEIKSGVTDTKALEEIKKETQEVANNIVDQNAENAKAADVRAAAAVVAAPVKSAVNTRKIWKWKIHRTTNEVERRFLDISPEKIDAYIKENSANIMEGSTIGGITFYKETIVANKA